MPTQRDALTPAERLLQTAATLFTREGIRAVGIDRLVAEAKVARASLYQNFGSKDALIAAYLQRQDELDRAAYQRATRRCDSAVGRVLALFDLAEAAARRRQYPGCLYLNAVTEFPDPKHPVSVAVRSHRQWLRDLLTTELTRAGAADPAALAEQIHLLYDGGLAGSKLSRSPEPIRLAKQMAANMIARASR
ncbi:TetR family transcriptional regulator [Carbonactinospora thermoautotrophica]|uniref:TetR/AcrR family transcriptional regulator n=1 Tax=Carbonactinospora thermoautotrophica TaxID=1469144 RepID=UPI00227123B4|nr:TetR/AcrR family transcriptional regulator [Carbonactinospora thermoautotrophica]MCX9192367.1 TetR family transcriptional regulator [Carbonactinospora thermoautotrophica]